MQLDLKHFLVPIGNETVSTPVTVIVFLTVVSLTAAGTKHRSQVIVLPIQKVSQTLVKANLGPN